MSSSEIKKATKQICITGERATNKFYNQILTDISNELIIDDKIEFLFGDCTGVDSDALKICKLLNIKYTVYAADWSARGLAAGPIRNKQMIDSLNQSDEVWAYHSDITKSKGTKNTISLAKKKKLKICGLVTKPTSL